jgi:hypothetical protein
MLQHVAIVRQLGVDDEAQVRQVDAARRNVGRHTNPRTPVRSNACRRVALPLLSSPDSATAEKPRSCRLAELAHRSRVLQNTSARAPPRSAAR